MINYEQLIYQRIERAKAEPLTEFELLVPKEAPKALYPFFV